MEMHKTFASCYIYTVYKYIVLELQVCLPKEYRTINDLNLYGPRGPIREFAK